MKIKIIVLLMVFASSLVHAQRQGNEWINYNNTYYKIKTGKDDIHRVSYEALQAAGMDVDNLISDNLHLYHRGEEVAIQVNLGGDGIFNAGDYIEFYGRRNDGTQDTDLFYRAEDQIHKYYNLFSDTTSFFLTEENIPGVRMQQEDINPAGLPLETLHREELLKVYTGDFTFGQYFPIGDVSAEVKRSLYERGQMFTSREIIRSEWGIANSQNYLDLVIDGIEGEDQAEGKPEVTIQLVGWNNVLHNASVFVGPNTDNLRLLRKDIFFNYNNFGTVNTQVEWNDIENGRLIIRVEEIGFEEFVDDRIGVSYALIRFPQTISAGGGDKVINLNANNGNQQIQIINANADAVLYDVTDYRNPVRISSQINGGVMTAGLTNNSNDRKLFVKQESSIIQPEVERVNFQYPTLANFNYYIISHPLLDTLTVDGVLTHPVQDYAAYRESPEGGSYNVMYANAPDLYDEFGYGEFTPLAIRRFMEKAYRDGRPEYLFLIGKSSRVDRQTQRSSNPLSFGGRELVPTMGAPGSDIMYTEGLSGVAHYPAFPVGRLSVKSAPNVVNYLNKVKEKEQTIKDSPWTKNFIQLSGGISTSELNRFRFFIDGFRDVVAADFLGASVVNLSKQNNNAIQNFNISEAVNRGVGFVTFFGHSSARFTDIDIGLATDPRFGYENQGRYPVFLVNGCRGGEIFWFSSFGENWIAAKDKGAINFIAHSDVGIPNVLQTYTENFYKTMADTLWMTRSIGHIQQRVILEQLDGPLVDEADYAVAEQSVLQGDPALQIFGHDKVDYIVREEDIFRQSVNDLPVTANSPFFQLGIVVNNAGRTSQDPVSVFVRRTLPDGTQMELPEVTVDPIRNRDTVYYQISNQGLDAFGDNKFEVFLDLNNEVDEGSETNNFAEANIFLGASGTFNTSPPNFAMINSTSATLVVQSADLKNNDKTYRVEIDTVNTFDSDWRQTTQLSGRGIAQWNVQLLEPTVNDSIQYYWRTIFEDELTEDPPPWNVSTFTYIENGELGWAQTEFDQFEELNLFSIGKNDNQDRWVFSGNETQIRIATFGGLHPSGGQPANMTVDVGGSSLFSDGVNRTCAPQSVNAIAFNQDSGQPYIVLRTPGINFETSDPLNCGVTPQVINRFSNTDLGDVDVLPSESLFRQYVDGVADGDFVLLFSNGTLTYGDWRQDVRDDLVRIGAESNFTNNLNTGEPFILYGVKGSPEGSADVVFGVPSGADPDATRTEINFSTSITAAEDSGFMQSPFIGPASQWGALFKDFDEDAGEDEIIFEVRGSTLDGTETLLFTLNNLDNLDLSSVDPGQYPFIRLYANITDRTSATPAQLQRWSVSYESVPEGVVNLENDQNTAIQLQEGEPFNPTFRFSNISAFDFNNTLRVRYLIRNQGTQVVEIDTIEIQPVLRGEFAEFNIPVNTRGKIGLNDLEVRVNLNDELEQYTTNNAIRLESFFNVIRDEVNPAMDVTFDGIYIMDGDIVSPTPMIEVELRDNNPFLYKTDTTGINIYLGQNCETCPLERVNFSDPNITFVPASENENFKVQYQPNELVDGAYLLQVNAADASGNLAGVGPYEINFEVVNESTVTNVYPYPNPFSTSTRFVFTLTGSEIPDQVKIQIFTVSGKLVREITQAELGALKIGDNITDYAWDGKDEFGDQLANGTYLYRVQMRSSNGTSFGQRATSKDRAFDNGFGKIVIIR